ncbi:conjugative transposon protein TraM [Aquimarina sp. RZ0]|uniref:conjugative transposon protein TraM n=1 Tax=Aquimarina sp. RZ0 TaxID=2607730 RepID=UPI0011F26916|nr:conjugative transposon protein TraM [Aquimarina sp. RZ0]KAA1242573.1 conjugative transposon protein TraM [Aquimarina sp. RZ0]
MDNNKKIIIGIVSVVLIGTLALMFKSLYFPDDTPENNMALNFDTPILDESKLKESSKKQLYDKESGQNYSGRYDSIFSKDSKDPKSLMEAYNNTHKDNDEDLQLLMDLQKALNDPSMQAGATAYPTAQDSYYTKQPKIEIQQSKKVEKPPIPKEGSYFFGASPMNKVSNTKKDLIPAETIDQGLYQAGATIAIRTKKTIHLPSQNVVIPKGAVVYGVVNMNGQRMTIDVNRYKRENKLYDIDFDVFDFDGLQGIHLKSKSIYSIPSNVSKDVYEAALQTYQQQQGGIGGNVQEREPLDKIAILSAAKEVSRELFDQRRIFVPRKYHLWLTINIVNDEK